MRKFEHFSAVELALIDAFVSAELNHIKEKDTNKHRLEVLAPMKRDIEAEWSVRRPE